MSNQTQLNIRPLPSKLSAIPPALRGGLFRLRARIHRLRRRAGMLLEGAGPLVRRALDVVGASFGLVIVSPLLATTAIAMKATSPGPIFFFQERLGQHGRIFRMVKMRTMVTGADQMKTALAMQAQGALDGVRFKLRRDPRVTAVGRIMRKFSIDELPQLWNVLRGDMTLVGPRPPVWREVALYDARALRRLEVRPGLTCLWQVGGRSDLSFEEQVALDIDYIDRVRPSQELLILLKTVPAVITGRGAY